MEKAERCYSIQSGGQGLLSVGLACVGPGEDGSVEPPPQQRPRGTGCGPDALTRGKKPMGQAPETFITPPPGNIQQEEQQPM